jgi:hypothetical protein
MLITQREGQVFGMDVNRNVKESSPQSAHPSASMSFWDVALRVLVTKVDCPCFLPPI